MLIPPQSYTENETESNGVNVKKQNQKIPKTTTKIQNKLSAFSYLEVFMRKYDQVRLHKHLKTFEEIGILNLVWTITKVFHL